MAYEAGFQSETRVRANAARMSAGEDRLRANAARVLVGEIRVKMNVGLIVRV